MLDALICATSEGASITGQNSRWEMPPFGVITPKKKSIEGYYTSSIFFSQDPVAIDSVGADFLAAEPVVNRYNSTLRNNNNVENYLHEAGGIGNASSGTVYKNGAGIAVTNVGVHEHWNNPIDKQYSRNTGKNEGIELTYIGK
jgi:hypothetical protein